jgi:hypothetical protein
MYGLVGKEIIRIMVNLRLWAVQVSVGGVSEGLEEEKTKGR